MPFHDKKVDFPFAAVFSGEIGQFVEHEELVRQASFQRPKDYFFGFSTSLGGVC